MAFLYSNDESGDVFFDAQEVVDSPYIAENELAYCDDEAYYDDEYSRQINTNTNELEFESNDDHIVEYGYIFYQLQHSLLLD
jgi:hypothetical protein